MVRPRKFFFPSLSFHNYTTYLHLFSTFSSDTSFLFDTQFLHLSILSIVIDFKRCNQFLSEIDSCCYGSDCVPQRNSCQLHSLVLTAFLNVIPVSYFSFQPLLSEFVLAFSPFSVPTADVRYVLVFLQCYPAIPAGEILWF